MIRRKAPTNVFCHPRVARLMELGYFDQRSDGWFAERRQRLTASDVDSVLNNNPYKSRKAVFKAKTSPQKQRTCSIHALHGIKYEPIAIQKFEEEYEKTVIDFGLIPHPEFDWLGASPDGICLTGEMVEVKCPSTRPIEKSYELGCPSHYYGQVQTQLWCANLDKCYFVQYRPGKLPEEDKPEQTFIKDELLSVTIVERSQEWFDRSIPLLKQFWDEVLEFRRTHPDWEKVDHHKKIFSFDDDEEEITTKTFSVKVI